MIVLHAPPHLQEEGEALCARHHSLNGHLFATSGTTSAPKWILHSQAGLDWCADTVNQHFACSSLDVWGLALPSFHVGGYCLTHRANRAGGRLAHYREKWSPQSFLKWAQQEAVTITSLVPTQVFDLVKAQSRAPSALRVALIGGDHLPEEIYQQARALGWPLILSYGMTETAGLIACSTAASPRLFPLPGWEMTLAEDKILALAGPGLFAGRLTPEAFLPTNKFFHTNDRAELVDGELKLLGRDDDQKKILGELVDLAKLRESLAATFPEQNTTVVATPDERKGWQLFAVFECQPREVPLDRFSIWNQHQPPFARLGGPLPLPHWQRTPLGKVDRQALLHRVINERDSLLPADSPHT